MNGNQGDMPHRSLAAEPCDLITGCSGKIQKCVRGVCLLCWCSDCTKPGLSRNVSGAGVFAVLPIGFSYARDVTSENSNDHLCRQYRTFFTQCVSTDQKLCQGVAVGVANVVVVICERQQRQHALSDAAAHTGEQQIGA